MSRIPEKRNRFLKNKIPLRIPIKMRNDTCHRNRGNKAADIYFEDNSEPSQSRMCVSVIL